MKSEKVKEFKSEKVRNIVDKKLPLRQTTFSLFHS